LPAAALAFGTFGSVKPHDTGGEVWDMAIGDMNRDGNADVLAVNDSSSCPGTVSGDISLLLGKGNGSFKPPVTMSDSHGPEGIAIGNFNGDKYKDFAVANWDCGSSSSSVWIFLGKKGGGFKVAQKIPLGPGAYRIRTADLNGDGKTDLVVGNFNSTGPDAVAVLLGKGNGTFSVPHYYASSGGVYGLAVGRMTSSKRPDVVTADFHDTVCVLLSRRNGSLGTAKCKSTAAAGNAVDPALGDFNRDGKMDVAVADLTGNRVLVLLGNGDGTLQDAIPTAAPTGVGPDDIVAGDFNRDGKLDVAIANNNSPYGTTVFLGKGNGHFKPGVTYTGSTTGEVITSGNLNSDKGSDLAVGTSTGVDVFLNKP
jgi:hypothetical protein